MNSLNKVKNEFEIIEIKEEKIFAINKKDEKIIIYNKEILERIIDKNFNKKYRELLCLTMSIIEDEDSTESDTELALLKIEDLKNYILSHYSKCLSKELLNKYLKMLMLLGQKKKKKKRGRGR